MLELNLKSIRLSCCSATTTQGIYNKIKTWENGNFISHNRKKFAVKNFFHSRVEKSHSTFDWIIHRSDQIEVEIKVSLYLVPFLSDCQLNWCFCESNNRETLFYFDRNINFISHFCDLCTILHFFTAIFRYVCHDRNSEK